MTIAADVQELASACQVCAHQLLEALLALGPRPDDAVAASLWDQSQTRLQGQINSLTALSSKLASSAVLTALEAANPDLANLGDVTRQAKDRIAQIQEVSKLLSEVSRILDVGLAVIAVAASPSPASLIALADKIDKLAS